MRFAMLGSGSQGNGTVLQAGSTTLLLDCGFMLRETESRLRRPAPRGRRGDSRAKRVGQAGAKRRAQVTPVRILRLAAGGDGVGKLPDGKTVFVPRTAPGDLVELVELREHTRFARAWPGR